MFWLLFLGLLTISEYSLWLPAWLLIAICLIIGAFGIMHLFHAYLRLSWATKTYKARLPSMMKRMIGLFPKLARYQTESAKIATHLILAGIALVLSICFDVYSPSIVSLSLGGVALTASLRAILPPGGVYLASSRPDRIQLFSQFSRQTIPAIAALLEVSNFADPKKNPQQFLKDASGLVNDYRTTDPDDWTSVVGQLLEMTAIIIVDGRDQTPGVRFEIERILLNRLDFKTTFLSVDGSLPPVLRGIGAMPSHPSGEFNILTPDMAVKSIPLIINEAHKYWIPVRVDA